MSSQPAVPSRLLYSRVDLRRRGINISNSSQLRMEAAGLFPVRVRLGGQKGRTVCWIATEIDEYIENLANEREAI